MKSSNKNSNKYNYAELNPIEIYELVIRRNIKTFPNHFGNCDQSAIYAPQITRYLIENILNWTDEDIKKKLRKSTFRDNSLGGLICIKYNDSAFATKWLIEEKLKWSETEIIERLNQDVFKENNLLGMLKKAFNCSLFEVIDATYPAKFKKWEIGDHVKNDYWNIYEGILAIKWLIKHKLKWNDKDIKENYSKQIYKDNNLYGMIQRCFNSSPFEAINSAYPNRFNEWELPNVPMSFWNSRENCINATKWLIE